MPSVEEVLVRAARYAEAAAENGTAILGWAEDRQVLAEEVRSLQGLDDRIRDLMDVFFYYDTPHTCEGDREARRSCMACLYIELNKALAPGWSPDGSAAVRPDGGQDPPVERGVAPA